MLTVKDPYYSCPKCSYNIKSTIYINKDLEWDFCPRCYFIFRESHIAALNEHDYVNDPYLENYDNYTYYHTEKFIVEIYEYYLNGKKYKEILSEHVKQNLVKVNNYFYSLQNIKVLSYKCSCNGLKSYGKALCSIEDYLEYYKTNCKIIYNIKNYLKYKHGF